MDVVCFCFCFCDGDFLCLLMSHPNLPLLVVGITEKYLWGKGLNVSCIGDDVHWFAREGPE